MCFAPTYEQHGAPLLYAGEKIMLTAAQEELATLYCETAPEFRTSKLFVDNFMADWSALLAQSSTTQPSDLSLCNFSRIAEAVRQRIEQQVSVMPVVQDGPRNRWIGTAGFEAGRFRSEGFC